jgi:hypothetical protein
MALEKPSPTARKIAQRRKRLDSVNTENAHKREAKRRDQYRCRFPLCGCGALRLRIESSHLRHKGHGGNPTGDRSQVSGLVTLCIHRHQHGRISIHKGTLRPHFLTNDQFNGTIAWEIDLSELGLKASAPVWREIARETSIQSWALTDWQRDTLQQLADMEF